MRRQLNNPLMEDYVEYLNRSSTETAEAESLMCYDQFVNALEKGKQHLSPRQRIIFEMNKGYVFLYLVFNVQFLKFLKNCR